MPRFDQTGPEGKGSQTGRMQGTCNNMKQNKKSCMRFRRFCNNGMRTLQSLTIDELSEYKQALLQRIHCIEKEMQSKQS